MVAVDETKPTRELAGSRHRHLDPNSTAVH
jgi:hypothetical protein